ncbi:MAG: AAA family ATPase [Gammaproteobacteria bacterium]|nr:AAA family ATPase [Gammaproteobacteria bacterium]
MQELHDLELLLTAHTPILIIESLEEVRATQLLTRLGLRLGQPMYQWTITEGLRRLESDFGAQKFNTEPDDLLKHIKALSTPGYFLLLDFHPFLDDPLHIRLIKEIAQQAEIHQKTVIFLSHALPIPPEISHLCVRFELHLPDQAGIKRIVREEADRWKNSHRMQIKADKQAITQLTRNLTGVTSTDARLLIRNAIENDGAITRSDLPQLMEAKYRLLGQDGVISFEYDTTRFSDVAGLNNLKQWLEQRRHAFSKEGSDPLKGIMLLGVQGGGKSLAAKAVAGTFNVPLLRIDFSALYNKYIGETEKNLREALRTAEVMAPCVLWIDEIEKGISSSQSDDGVSQRILGALLTWMAERREQVFIVATANNIQKLPPELIRKGRLDEIFFVDLPDDEVRREIFEIHLRQRNLPPSRFDLDLLADISDGFTGAEIEQAIVSARYAAQSRDQSLDTDHLLAELERTRPLSIVMEERISALRAWAAERTVPA